MQNEDKEINAIHEVVSASEKALYELTPEGFMTFISTTMELYCARHDLDVVETAQEVAAVVTLMNMGLKSVTS